MILYIYSNIMLMLIVRRFNVMARSRIDKANGNQYDVLYNGNDLRGIVVDPINE